MCLLNSNNCIQVALHTSVISVYTVRRTGSIWPACLPCSYSLLANHHIVSHVRCARTPTNDGDIGAIRAARAKVMANDATSSYKSGILLLCSSRGSIMANWILVNGVLSDLIDLAAAIPTIYLALRYLFTMPSMSILLDGISARSLTWVKAVVFVGPAGNT